MRRESAMIAQRLGKTPQEFRNVSEAVFADEACSILREEFGPLRNASKLLGYIAGSSPRSAENWLHRRAAPEGEHLMRLLAAIPRLRAAWDARVDALEASNRALCAQQDARTAAMRWVQD